MARKYVKKSKGVKFSRKLNVSQPVKTYVKRMIKTASEYKQIQSVAATTGNPVAMANATWINIGGLTAIGNGTGDTQRIGNTVSLRSIKLSATFIFDGYTATAGTIDNAVDQGLRVVVFQLKKNATPALLTASLVFAGTPFGLNDDLGNNENIKDLAYVLYDKTYHRFKDTQLAYTTATNILLFNSKAITIKKNLKFKAKTLKWNVATAGVVEPDEQGAIYLYAFSSQINDSTATTMPLVYYHEHASQVNFMDM